VNAAESFFFRWRVRVGYPLAIVVLWFAQPTQQSIIVGAFVGAVGLWLRAYAAGYLHKQEVLTVTGPYAYTRNPLYLGSAILAAGVALVTRSWISGAILLGYFALFYSFVMRREARELRSRHGAAFDDYVNAVPLFFPRLTAARLGSEFAGNFSFAQYKKNREWQAGVGFSLVLGVLIVIWRLRAH
jgi:protein-S-isoprenylcysteine O-methyltransferase Ste14